MIITIVGGSGSGKSEYAQNLISALHESEYSDGRKIYLATMKCYGEEGTRRVARHLKLRENMNFETIEQTDFIDDIVASKNDVVLIEDMSNLAANAMFDRESQGATATKESIADSTNNEKADNEQSNNEKAAAEESTNEVLVSGIIEQIVSLNKKVGALVIVTNDVNRDSCGYDELTRQYIKNIAAINAAVFEMSDKVYEIVYSIGVRLK